MLRNVSVLIPCAGSGKRMGSEIPKQFLEIEGKPILFYTLKKFEMCAEINEIILIAHSGFITDIQTWISDWGFQKVLKIVPGGKERQDSVQNGLNALDEKTDIVLIHDAVRPFVSQDKIIEVIDSVRGHKAAVLAVPTKNTVKEIRDGVVQQTVNRDVLWQVQTPQGFEKNLIVKAYLKAMHHGVMATDDAMFVEYLGEPVYIVEGEDRNFKITSPEDLKIATFYIQSGNL